MLSPKTAEKLEELQGLLRQREEVDSRIEALLAPTADPVPTPTPVIEHTSRKESAPRGRKRGTPRPSKFTEAQIAQMIRESDEGKSADEIVRTYGFGSKATWYTIKSKYKKKNGHDAAPADLPAYDDADDREVPDDLPIPEKKYSYECRCGYRFKSAIPPKLVKCPDCKGRPRLDEEVDLTNVDD